MGVPALVPSAPARHTLRSGVHDYERSFQFTAGDSASGGMRSLIRFLHEYSRPGAVPLTTHETTYGRADRRLPATLYRPAGKAVLPGWVVLHGLTATGRSHPSLVRFARSVAAAGNVVMVPEIPEWRNLRVAPAVTHETIRAAVRELHDRSDTDPDRIGLFGFSFGATQALIAAADPHVQGLIAGIAAWGGYADLHRLFVFGMSGQHELDGREWKLDHDPYGAWVMAGNYLTGIPGHENDGAVATALHELALEAGRVRAYAWESVYDPYKVMLRSRLEPGQRELFDLLAPPSDRPPRDVERLRGLAHELADAALRVDPLLDPSPFLDAVGVRIVFAHGRDDRLVPFSETVRLSRAVPAEFRVSCSITSLFDHSGRRNRQLRPGGVVIEGARFVHVLHRILHLI
jgi:acetyl esterase/lipase